MNQWEWMAVGAVGGIIVTICVYGIVRAGRTVWNILKSFEASLKKAVDLTSAFHEDFKVLRQVVAGSVVSEQVNSSQPEGEDEPTSAPAKRVPFPPPVYDRFRQEPIPEVDAENGEVVDVTGNDLDYIDAEKTENLREAGFVIEEPLTPPPGREVDAE